MMMTDTDAVALMAEAQGLAERLESAWNSADGHGFAAAFAEDADFVNVLGMHARGRDAIAEGHRQIFSTIYRGSQVGYRVESARLLRPEVGLVHVHAVLEVPGGAMAGRHEARYSLVLTRDGGDWRIASFHNTFIRDPKTMGR
jgi:uncharacterized protein (TIGR02246 family)